MRDFGMTAEPRGAGDRPTTPSEALPFVIQKHAATRLHYDFRLGWRGVLKSWAVTKGPSYNTADKRLAVEVEDHPIEYGGFEGAIPKGQYGGGTVMVWDQGTWEPLVDADEGLRKGNLKFALNGTKMHGHWVLVRMHPRAFERSGKPNWLLIKEHDEYARTADDPCITDEEPNSAVTGRSLEEIAAAEDHVWNSNAPTRPVQKTPANHSRLAVNRKKKPARAKAAQDETTDRKALLKDAPKEKLPGFLSPELAMSVAEPPEGEAWLHELKLDGYRIQIHIDEKGGKRHARLFTRRGLDWTHRMTAVAEAATELPVKAAILDGEVVVLNEHGGTSFADLQAAFDEGARHPLTYFAFDLLHLDGHNLRVLPLEQRKAMLEAILRDAGDEGALRYSSHIRNHGGDMFLRACEMGAEGVVSKLANAPWRSERSRDWVKSKCVLQQEFVVGGFTPYSRGGEAIGSLLLGYYQDGRLVYAGRTGTGFDRKMRALLRRRLDELQQAKTPFDRPPAEAKKDAVWVKPELVVEVRFATWTAGGNVRQAAFLGIREDKRPGEVVRESPQSVPRSAREARPHVTPGDVEESVIPSATQPAVKRSAKGGHRTPYGAAAEKAYRADIRAKTLAGTDPSGKVAAVKLTHPEKILDEQSQMTKSRLADYYAAVAEHMLPHIADRPLSLVRCPEGSGKPCFFQKHIGMGVPAGVGSVPVRPKSGGAPEQYLTLSTTEGLVGLAQMGVLEIHPWGSRNESMEQPDRLIIDLDPDPALPWKQLVESAEEVRKLMRQLGLESFVKSTGGKGIHVVAPLKPEREWPEVKGFAHNFVLMMERANPKLYLTKMTRSARTGKIFLDYLRNERGATAVAPFSPRARAGARVAMPMTWKELRRTDPTQFSVVNFAEWKSRLKHDPWMEMDTVKQKLTDRAVEAVAEMLQQSA